MAQYFYIHPKDPPPRLIRRSVDILSSGGIVVYPTDSSYALGCKVDSKEGLERIRRIRQLDKHHHFTLVCLELSQIATFAKINNEAFKLIKSLTPGPFTFVLPATRETPRRLQDPKRKTIGVRLPDHPVALSLVRELQEPLFSTTLILPGEKDAVSHPDEVRKQLEKEVDLIIDSGPICYEPTTVLDFAENAFHILRHGKGILPS